MKYTLIALIIAIQIFALRAWTICKFFEDRFHLSTFDLSLRLNEAINNDYGTSLTAIRFFHNKGIGIVFDLFKHYMHFLDLPFLVHVFSFTGLFGLGMGIWSITKLSNKLRYTIFSILLLLPFIEIFLRPQFYFMAKIVLYGLPYFAVIVYGYFLYLQKLTRGKIITIVILSILSIWWVSVMYTGAATYCIMY